MLDHPVDRLLRAGATLRLQAPGNLLLRDLRRDALRATLASHRPRADALADRLAAGDGAARDELATIGDEALSHMRAATRSLAARHGLASALAARVDAWWSAPTEGEYIDDESLDPELRSRAMRDLDAVNDVLQNYRQFFEALLPLAAPGRPTRILDLAAGHGGFALAAARTARARGLDLAITATDIKQEYLDLGAAIAAREGLAVDFAVQDALDLSNLEPGSHDVLVCTQSTHHFPAGLVAVMFEAATRIAARGVVFIDGCRSMVKAWPLWAVARWRYRNDILAHDAYISFRRFYVPEELELLARIGRWGDAARGRWLHPGHCLLEYRTS
jgi:2-polyprenyl-3-methyl-5-hydroxy-6-metoxy-1,4-benzoquinol methylase